jgi:hypothetical protein
LRPKDANPSDSMGDLNFWFGKFKEAAANYQEAHARQPGFEQDADLYKAAWAKFRAGDKAGADALFSQFRTERAKSDVMTELRAADWLYRTGREVDAVQALRKLGAETKSAPLSQIQIASGAYAQLTIWDLLARNRAQAAKDAASLGASLSHGSGESAPAFMARFAAMPSAPASEWKARAERLVPPSMVALRRLALGYALVLDGKREAALPVWEQIVKTSGATDFFAKAIYARLQGKVLEHALLPDPVNLNQFAALPDKL